MSLGEAQVPVRLTLDKLDRDLNQARGKIDGALGKLGGGLQSLGKVALVGIATGVAAVGGAMAVAGKHAIKLGADAGETASLLETSLGPAAAGLNSELREFATNANRSFFELQEGSATFVAMTKSMGATEQQAADLGVGFTTAATDLGSFFNVPTEQSLMDIQGALAGSSETLQKYGIDVRETTLKQMALDQGLISTASETIPRLDRAMLIQQAITEQAADAMGDAERTSDSWQNVMRGLQGRLKDTATEIGMKLIPALEPLLGKFLDLTDNVLAKLLPILEDVIEVFGQFIENIIGGSEPISALTGLIWNLLGAFGVGEETATSITETFFTLADGARTLWNRITALLAPVVEAIGNFVSWKDVLIGLGIAIASVVIPVIISIASSVAPVIAAFVLVTAAVALLRNAWENNWGGIRDILTNVWEGHLQPAFESIQAWLAVNIPVAIEAVKQFWEGTLQPALAAIGAFITGTVVPAISDLVTWLQTNIPVAIQAVKRFWDDTLQPALAAIGAFITGTVVPAINTLVGWLSETLTGAFATVKGFWEDTLQPALSALWDFISGDVIPVIESFSEVVTELAEIAFTALQGAWENILKPALDALWGVIQDNVIPAVEDGIDVLGQIADFLKETLGPVVNTLVDGALAGLKGAFQDIKTVLGGLKGLLDRFKTALEGVTLPGFLQPGSPSPFENSLRGIADALQAVTAQLPGLGSALAAAADGAGALLQITGELSGIGGAIGSIFKARELDPLESRLQSTTTAIDEVTKSVNESLSELGISDIAGFTGQDRADLQLRLMRSGYRGLANDIAKLTNLRGQEVRLADELAEKEQKLLDLQEQQQDLKLLEAQQRLLDLIRENNLSTSILDGLQLGLEADLGGILQATSAAMEELIAVTEGELGIASASKVFKAIGQNAMASFKEGFASLRPQFDLDRMLPVMTPSDVGRPIENRSVHYNPVTTVETNRDPMRVLRASRHLDKLGRLS